jgi:hypothetical protein
MTHTPEECARHLLDVFVEFDCQPNEALSDNSFLRAFLEIGWQPDDYAVGLKQCLTQHWVKPATFGALRVTPTGLHQVTGANRILH